MNQKKEPNVPWPTVLVSNSMWKIQLYDGLNLRYGWDATPIYQLVFRKTELVRLSDILLELHLLPSRAEFSRRLKAGAIYFGPQWANYQKIDHDPYISLQAEVLHTTRFGKLSLLQIITPGLFGWRKWLGSLLSLISWLQPVYQENDG